MPFIEEENLRLLQEDLDNNKLKREVAENELSETQEILTSTKKKSKKISILLGLLLGVSLGACYYFYNSNTNSFTEADIALMKKKESVRVLDSITRANKRALRNKISSTSESENNSSEISSENLEDTIGEVKSNTTGETIYSVQIGAFHDKTKFPLLSEKIIPSIITSKNNYFKYSLGLFTTLEEAKELKQELISLGIEDAFVASYIDGKRQKIHD